jgi:preprotein translocase subunit SecF
MKKIIYILILGFFACKSTKTNTNNQLDISKETIEKKETRIKVKQIDLNDYEITFHTANNKLPVKITDKKGNTQTFTNVKKATLKQKTEQKKDSVVNQNFTTEKKETDNSKIKESAESVSDANNYKWMLISLAILGICILIIYLVFKFKK